MHFSMVLSWSEPSFGLSHEMGIDEAMRFSVKNVGLTNVH